MATTYETVNPSPIENTIVTKVLINDVHRLYRIQAIEGYVLHDNRRDNYVDPETGEELASPILGYTAGVTSVAANYDFLENPNNFFTVPRTEVPEDQIFGGGNNNNEEIS